MLKRFVLALAVFGGGTALAHADGSREARPARAGRTAASGPRTGMGQNPVGGSDDGRAGMPPRAEDLSGPASTHFAGRMRYYAVTRLDPLTGSTMDSPGSAQTPSMAGSTGAWTSPVLGSPQSVSNPRGTGVQEKDPDAPPR